MSKIPHCPNCSLHELVCICIHKKLQGWSVDITLFRQITQWSMDCWLMWPQATTEMCRFNFSPSLVSQICTLWRVKVAELLLFPVHADTLRHTAHSLATIVIQMKPCCQCFPCRPEATGQPDMTSSSVLTSWRAEMLWIQLFFKNQDGSRHLMQSDRASWQILYILCSLAFFFSHLDMLEVLFSACKHNVANLVLASGCLTINSH